MEDKIIKELAKQIEKEKEEKIINNKNLFINENLTKEEINEIYSSEKISNENNIDTYSIINNIPENKIKELSLKKRKVIKLYNEKIGEFLFKSNNFSEKENFLYKNSYISNLLKDSEIINLINYNNKFDIHDEKNFYPLFYKYCNNYRDIQFCCNNLEIRENLMKIYLFHIINHVLKRKEEIEINDNIEKIINENNNKTNSEKLEKILFRSHEEEFIENYYKKNNKYFNNNLPINNNFFIFNKIIKKKYSFNDLDEINIKDQGFTSPKILILVPYKKHARIIIEEIISIFKGDLNGISNKKKFKDEYSEFESLDDCFRMGISFNYFDNKINLYSPFNESDIIFVLLWD